MPSPTTTLSRPKLTPTAETSEITGIPIYRLRALVHEGLPCVHIGRKLYFNPDAVTAWLSENLTNGEASPAPAEPDTPAPALTDPDGPSDDWVAAQVSKFSPEDMRRAGELLLALSKAAAASTSAA